MQVLRILRARPWLSVVVGLLLVIGSWLMLIRTPEQEYEAALARWQAQHIADYEITVTRNTALDSKPMVLRVHNGSQTIEMFDSQGAAIPVESYTYIDTVEGIFSATKNLLAHRCTDIFDTLSSFRDTFRWSPPNTPRGCVVVSVQYDPTLGYVTLLDGKTHKVVENDGSVNLPVIVNYKSENLKVLQRATPTP